MKITFTEDTVTLALKNKKACNEPPVLFLKIQVLVCLPANLIQGHSQTFGDAGPSCKLRTKQKVTTYTYLPSTNYTSLFITTSLHCFSEHCDRFIKVSQSDCSIRVS